MVDVNRFRELVELPAIYTYKVIGELEATQVMDVVNQTLTRDTRNPELTTRPSKKGNFQAHTLKIFLLDHEELAALYQAFQKLPGARMVL